MFRPSDWSAWWETARSSLVTHRRLKWLWVFLVIPTIIWWSLSVRWLVFMSIYAIITGHWSGEESAKVEVKQEEAERCNNPSKRVGMCSSAVSGFTNEGESTMSAPEHPQPPAPPEPKPAPTQSGTTDEKEPVYDAEVRPTEGPEN